MSKLTITQANRIIAAGFEYAHKNKIKPLGIVVLDDSGNIVSAQRDDGATMFRIDVATGKAWAAVGMGASSRALAARAKDNPNFFVALAATGKGRFLPQTGAVLIKDGAGNVLGAAGASGGTGEEDEAACMHGIEAAGLTHG
ncbi:MAG: heme-binding protein [Burkholderiales bacterium]|nr:heme-binding protein [Burkholderiales bacterium]